MRGDRCRPCVPRVTRGARCSRARRIAAYGKAGLDYVFSGHYEGEHWLATFAIYLLTEVGVAE